MVVGFHFSVGLGLVSVMGFLHKGFGSWSSWGTFCLDLLSNWLGSWLWSFSLGNLCSKSLNFGCLFLFHFLHGIELQRELVKFRHQLAFHVFFSHGLDLSLGLWCLSLGNWSCWWCLSLLAWNESLEVHVWFTSILWLSWDSKLRHVFLEVILPFSPPVFL